MKETGNRSKEVLRHRAWEKMVKFSRSKKSFFVILAVFFLLQLSAVAGYEISFTVPPLRTYSYAIDLQRNDLLTYCFSVTGGDGSIKFAIKDSGGRTVSDVGKVIGQYCGEFIPPRSDSYSLCFSNLFATVQSKHVRLTYDVRSPSPPPPAGGSVKVLTDKTSYVRGETVLITVYYTKPLDWCLYHLVKCEIFDPSGRLSGSNQWDDRYTSFPQPWPFQLFQQGTYTIVASFWHNGQTKGGEDKRMITMISPAPPPPSGFIQVTTDKSAYVTGEAVVITVYYTRPTDLCINHIVRCEVIAFFDGRSELCGSRQWDDRQTSFPQTWSFTLFQPYTYTITASIWHGGTSKGEESSVRVTMVSPVVTTTVTTTTASPVTTREVSVTTATLMSPVATGVDVSVAFVMVVATALAVGLLASLALRKERTKRDLRGASE